MIQKSRLHIPHPPARPGDKPDFSYLQISQPGEVMRPDVNTHAMDMADLAQSMVRVLKDNAKTTGPWNPHLEPEVLQVGLRHMMLTRAFDERMQRVQRQGKISFYVKCTGKKLSRSPRQWHYVRETCCSRPTGTRGCKLPVGASLWT
ncbi:MAG: hypothetical protein OEM03_01475 [Chromatiales bacterium]|nr:hypothetical protein [Chromatiales bacterium]